jgi:hypothetical protein
LRFARESAEDGAVSETTTPQDRLPAAEEAFAERLAPLMELVERWRARIVTEVERWPAVPLSELDPDDPPGQTHEISRISARGAVSDEAVQERPEPVHLRLAISLRYRLSR